MKYALIEEYVGQYSIKLMCRVLGVSRSGFYKWKGRPSFKSGVMIIVIGSIVVKEGCIDEALEISQQHVDRSRNEPGCITHGVHIDSENAQRLTFVEQWVDQAALSQHFQEPASIGFVKTLESIITQAPTMSIYDAAQLK